jgi:hypothetical protein
VCYFPFMKVKVPTPSTWLRAGSVAKNATRVGHPRDCFAWMNAVHEPSVGDRVFSVKVG